MQNEENLKLHRRYARDLDRICERRIRISLFYTALHTIFLSFIAVLFLRSDSVSDMLTIAFLSLLGVGLTLLWKGSLTSCDRLTAAKLHVMHDLEKNPEFRHNTDMEWEVLKNDKKYRPLSTYEVRTALLFFVAYAVTAVAHVLAVINY